MILNTETLLPSQHPYGRVGRGRDTTVDELNAVFNFKVQRLNIDNEDSYHALVRKMRLNTSF